MNKKRRLVRGPPSSINSRSLPKSWRTRADFENIRGLQAAGCDHQSKPRLRGDAKGAVGHLIDEVLSDRKKSGLSGAAQIEDIIDHLLVQFGCDILEIVPGRVSTETDARLSFDVEGSIEKARHLIKLYKNRKISRERVLIKIASTWEGINAAEKLQKEGIRCNLTLLFYLPQADAMPLRRKFN